MTIHADATADAKAHKAVHIDLRDFHSAPMRAFHMAWIAFFVCFFGWFGIAPLMAAVRMDLGLGQREIGNLIIASVAATVVARPIVGWLCDRFGPRRTYSWLLIGGAFPVMGLGLATSYESLLLLRLAVGVIGASFVITQFHTSVMFAPNCVGTANATSAGWGNLGGGVAQIAMPLLMAGFVALGVTTSMGWRLTMVVPGLAMIGLGIAYRRVTQDTPSGNFESGNHGAAASRRGSLREAARDHRVWVLALIYGACFGVELTIHNVAAIYFHDHFKLGLEAAGLAAACFGMMNIFARTLGGFFADKLGIRYGLRGRVAYLGLMLAGEGATLMAFSRAEALPIALVTLIVFSLFVQMSEGATFSLVPMINPTSIGSTAGLVGAGGNLGAVAAGFLFRVESMSASTALLIIGAAVFVISATAMAIRFSAHDEAHARAAVAASLERRGALLLRRSGS